MVKKNGIATAVRAVLLFSSASGIAFTSPLYAAEESKADSEGKVIITGSRIRREGYESPSPVTSISAEQIKQSGAITLGDILNESPQLRSTFSTQNSGRFIGTSGVGLLDLRGLGTARTLVLVNGRRHVAGSDGSSSVDVNSIPADMIERIDIITGANAAVYGADAVTGVVNFILKDSVDGTTVSASNGEAADTGFNRSSFSLTTGSLFADNKGSSIVSLSWAKQDPLSVGEKGGRLLEKWAEVPNPDDGDTIVDGIEIDDGIPDNIYVNNYGLWYISEGGYSPQLGGFVTPNGGFEPFTGAEIMDGIRCGGEGCPSLDLDSFQLLQVELERWTVDANFKYELSDDHTWFLETRMASVESRQQGQPSFDFTGAGGITIFRDNAFISSELGSVMDAAGGGPIGLNRFNTDLGLRKEVDKRDTFRLVTGLEGFLSNNWEYEGFINYGRTRIQRLNENNRIDERWFAAIDAVTLTQSDIDNATSNPALLQGFSAGDAVCRSTLQAATGGPGTAFLSNGLPAPTFAYEGCQALNVLGAGNASQRAKDFIMSTAIGAVNIEQKQFQFYVNNSDLFQNWAGNVGFVAGVEYRKDTNRSNEDSLSVLGNTFFNALAETNGSITSEEVFAEVSLPLLRDLPGAESMTLELAARSSDYSTIGSTTTWEARLNWKIYSDLDFRATTGESFRSPTISDLFDPLGENFSFYTHPCDMDALGGAVNGRATRVANCQTLGISDPENFVADDNVTTPVLQGGNRNLGEEKSESFTAGFVWSPSQLEGFNLAIDYWDIEISDAITGLGVQNILNKCVDDPNGINNQFCGLVTFQSDGNVALVQNFPVNLNVLSTAGVDFEADYSFDLNSAGNLRARIFGSYLLEREFQDLTGAEVVIDDVVGELGDPELQYNIGLNWNYESVEVFMEARYIDEMYLVAQETLFGSPTNPDPNPDVTEVPKTSSEFFVDMGASYTFDNGMIVGLSIDNVTDNTAPFPLFGNGGGSSIYDSVGRFYTLEAQWTF